jgi:hypothetical protein
MMTRSIVPRAFALAALLALGSLATSAGAQETRPLRVFVLAGQSNMQGHAHARTVPSLELSPHTAPLLAKIHAADGSPRVYEEVRVASLGSAEEERVGNLSIGFGADERGPKLGPELGFGIAMHERLAGPILLIKTAWGGKSLHTDFRPPSAGRYEFDAAQLAAFTKEGKDQEAMRAEKDAATGRSYRAMIDYVRSILADLPRVVPGYDAEKGYELAGFVWFQGWNDMVDGGAYPRRGEPGGYDAYSEVLGHLIRDVRKDLSAPALPFVIGVLGVGGPVDLYPPDQKRYVAIHESFRKAMEAPASWPEFRGNVVAVRTETFWDQEVAALRLRERDLQPELRRFEEERKAGKLRAEEANAARAKLRAATFTPRELRLLDESVSNAEYHYLGSARILVPIGNAFAEALFRLEKR